MIGQWALSDLQQAFAGDINRDQTFTGVSTDTRTLNPGDLFVALVGPNFNGHRFIQQAIEKGAVAAVVSEDISAEFDADIPQWQVADTRIALGQIAKANRQRFSGTLFAVTGSSGKTTVKEMLFSILSQKSSVLATKGNLNNDIGVPLTLFELSDQHEIAVIEQGASARGEIAYTTEISLPDVAILNNAMGAHLEGFGSLQGVVEAKSEIYDQLATTQGTGIINLDDPNVGYWLDKTQEQKRLTFAIDNDGADIRATDLKANDEGCFSFTLHWQGQARSVQLQVMGRHNVANALAASAAVFATNMPIDEVVSGLEAFTAVAGRMRRFISPQGALIIDDSYNANPGSVMAAIDLLTSLPGESVLVLGDMAELGDDALDQHKQVGCRAAQKGTQRFYATGALSRHSIAAYDAAIGQQGMHFTTRNELTAALKDVAKKGVNILIKGSRSAAMDQVVKSLTDGE